MVAICDDIDNTDSEIGQEFSFNVSLGRRQHVAMGEKLGTGGEPGQHMMEVLAIPRSELLVLCSQNPEIGMRIYAAVGRLMSNRYSETLAHLAYSAERELRESNA